MTNNKILPDPPPRSTARCGQSAPRGTTRSVVEGQRPTRNDIHPQHCECWACLDAQCTALDRRDMALGTALMFASALFASAAIGGLVALIRAWLVPTP